MSGGTRPFRAAYASALSDYLRDPSEQSLRTAYELGREAVGRRMSVLDLAVIHQEGLLSALTGVSEAAETQHVTSAAGTFFLESLSSFEMVQRGFDEARETARHERHLTQMSRQLSTFLADASLALDAPASMDEMLRLVAEQARELVAADCCVATVAVSGQPRAAEAASYSQPVSDWYGFVQWLDFSSIYRLIRSNGGSIRISDDQLAHLAPFLTRSGKRPLRGWLAASLNALDGTDLGAIQLFDKHDGAFTEDDEGVLVHLAQMASAAVDRARLYQNPR